jgi:hypothetical protein
MARQAARAAPAQRSIAHRRGAAPVSGPCKRCKDSRIVFDDEGRIAACPVCPSLPKKRAKTQPVAKRRHWSDERPHASHVFDDAGYCKGCAGHRRWAVVREACSIRYRPPMGSLAPRDDESE